MEKFVIEVLGTPKSYVGGIRVTSDGQIFIQYTFEVEKAALFTEEAAALFVMEAANAGLTSYWASPVKLEIRMLAP